jgi:hypothetical protein
LIRFRVKECYHSGFSIDYHICYFLNTYDIFERCLDISNTEAIEVKDSYDHHRYYADQKNQILNEFKEVDSLRLWNKHGEIIDADSTWSTPEGSGWLYSVNDSMELYQYREFAETRCWVYMQYVKNGNLLMYREVEIVHNTPFGYIKDEALAGGDSTEYGEPEDFEELSIFKDSEIIYQLSPDCGAPNSLEYVRQTQEGILEDLGVIRNLIMD